MQFRTGKIVSCLAILIFLLSTFTTAAAQPAREDDDTGSVGESCYSLDVIFIIDQSGSMSEGGIPTDPTNQRETAVEAMVDWLAENALDRCPDARHQVGVISFGTDPHIDLPMKEVAPSDFKQYLSLTRNIHESITSTNLGLTDPIKAFRLARTMFADNTISGGGFRKKVIVFLTDGIINQGNGRPVGETTTELADWIERYIPFDPVLLSREQCLANMVDTYGSLEETPYEYLNECIQDYDVSAAAYANSVYIHMVLMNYGSAWPRTVKTLYSQVTASHGGKVMDFYDEGLSDNRNAIPAYFQTVLAELIGVPSGVIACGANVVNPYLDHATFIFYKYSPDTVVKIRYVDAQGVQHEIANNEAPNGGFEVAEYSREGTNERYIFKNPYPGIWYVESDRCTNGGVNVFYSEVALDAAQFSLTLPVIPQYDLPPYYDESDPFRITYQMHDVAGNVVQNADDPFFSVDASATVTDPSGKQLVYPMRWDAVRQQFETVDPVQVPIPGPYAVELTGVTKKHTGEFSSDNLSKEVIFADTRVLFDHSNLQFTVAYVTPFVITAETPRDNQRIGQIHQTILSGFPLKVSPIRVEVHMALREGELDVPVSEILTDPTTAFTAYIEYPDETLSETFTLRQDPNDPATFVGTVEGIDSTSPLKLHIDLTGSYSDDYRPDHRNLVLNISRYDSLPIYRNGFYILLGILLLLALIGWIIYQVWLRKNKLQGYVDFMMNGNTIYSLPVFNGRRIFKLKNAKGANVHLQGLKLSNKTREKEQSEDGMPPLLTIEVAYQNECKEKGKFRLSPGESNSYCTNHPEYEILYRI
jgi:hypothetical protein